MEITIICCIFVIQTQKLTIMKATDLVKSFMETAKWSSFKDGANRPIRGIKWITRKQCNFLHDLFYKENPDAHFDGYIFIVGDYNVKVNRIAPNGSRCLSIELINEVSCE